MSNRVFQISLLSIVSLLVILPQAQASRIIEAVGRVEVKRNGALNYGAAGVGTILNQGDLIRPASQARVVVLCSNNTPWRVPSGVPSGLLNGCPDEVARFNTRGRGEDDFLAFLNQEFVYATQFLDSRPLLRWNPIADATAYTVKVTDETENILWERTVTRSHICYGGDTLQPNTTYYLTVTATNQQEQSQSFYLAFRIVDESTVSTVEDAIAPLRSTNLSETAEALAVTQVYQNIAQPNTDPPESVGLVMDAIAALEDVVSPSQSPYVHRLLGDLYLQVGLLNAAAAQYQATLNLEETDINRGDRASAQVGLANIAAATGDREAAAEWLQQARATYLVLQEGDRVSLIDQWIEKLR